MSVESGGLIGALVYKIGAAKLIGLGAELLGAAMMAVFRTPANKAELFKQAFVALGASLILGPFGVFFLLKWLELQADPLALYSVVGIVHGLIGAFSWGIFGGIAVLRDKLSKDPVQTVKDVKDIL